MLRFMAFSFQTLAIAVPIYVNALFSSVDKGIATISMLDLAVLLYRSARQSIFQTR